MGKNWKLVHIAVIVRDLDKAVKYYKSLGIAEIGPDEGVSPHKWADFMVYDKPADPNLKIKIRRVKIGQVEFEVIQPAGGESIWQDFLDSKGEGVHHICFDVGDFKQEKANLVEKGALIQLATNYPSDFAYFDLNKGGDMVIELWQTGDVK